MSCSSTQFYKWLWLYYIVFSILYVRDDLGLLNKFLNCFWLMYMNFYSPSFIIYIYINITCVYVLLYSLFSLFLFLFVSFTYILSCTYSSPLILFLFSEQFSSIDLCDQYQSTCEMCWFAVIKRDFFSQLEFTFSLCSGNGRTCMFYYTLLYYLEVSSFSAATCFSVHLLRCIEMNVKVDENVLTLHWILL